MKLTTINKIINYNLRKNFSKEISNNLFDTYFIFLSLSYVDYNIRLCKKLSICNTPVIELTSNNKNNIAKLYYWLSEDGDCYIKDCTETVITSLENSEEIIFDKLK